MQYVGDAFHARPGGHSPLQQFANASPRLQSFDGAGQALVDFLEFAGSPNVALMELRTSESGTGPLGQDVEKQKTIRSGRGGSAQH
ncbi:MAG: hypothetical protein JHC55_14580 [Mycolicibacterium sp.]|nr:hypothetical protein [Mycolicibacterium sp.]